MRAQRRGDVDYWGGGGGKCWGRAGTLDARFSFTGSTNLAHLGGMKGQGGSTQQGQGLQVCMQFGREIRPCDWLGVQQRKEVAWTLAEGLVWATGQEGHPRCRTVPDIQSRWIEVDMPAHDDLTTQGGHMCGWRWEEARRPTPKQGSIDDPDARVQLVRSPYLDIRHLLHHRTTPGYGTSPFME